MLRADPGGLGDFIQPRHLPLERTRSQRRLCRLQFPRQFVDAPGEIRLGNRITYTLGNGFALLFGNQLGAVQIGFKRGVITTLSVLMPMREDGLLKVRLALTTVADGELGGSGAIRR